MLKKIIAITGIVAIAAGSVAFSAGSAQAISLNMFGKAAAQSNAKEIKAQNKSFVQLIKSIFSPRANAVKSQAEDSAPKGKTISKPDHSCIAPGIQGAINVLFNAGIIDANMKADLETRLSNRPCPTPSPAPIPQPVQYSLTVTGFLEGAGPSMNPLGDHLLRVTHINPTISSNQSVPPVGKIIFVRAQNSAVETKLNSYENSYVRISGLSTYPNMRGGSWEIIAQDVTQIQTDSTAVDMPPVIDGIAGPTQLTVGQTGIWKISAHDDGAYLAYGVNWGDVSLMAPFIGNLKLQNSNSAELSHSYSAAGIYTITFRITDQTGHTSTASMNVNVVSSV